MVRKDKVIHVRVPTILYETLETLETKISYGGVNFTKSDFIREAILQFVNKNRDKLEEHEQDK